MTSILFVGQKPETVDFSDPSLPPGFDADKINAGIAIALDKIRERGWQGRSCMITPDAAGGTMLEAALRGATYACVVIGGGLRLPPKSLELFETVVNLVHKAAPNAAIAFNTRPEDSRSSRAPTRLTLTAIAAFDGIDQPDAADGCNWANCDLDKRRDPGSEQGGVQGFRTSPVSSRSRSSVRPSIISTTANPL